MSYIDTDDDDDDDDASVKGPSRFVGKVVDEMFDLLQCNDCILLLIFDCK